MCMWYVLDLLAHGTAGPSLCFWRAATDNDRAGWPTLLNFVVDHRFVGFLSKFLPLSRLRYIASVCVAACRCYDCDSGGAFGCPITGQANKNMSKTLVEPPLLQCARCPVRLFFLQLDNSERERHPPFSLPTSHFSLLTFSLLTSHRSVPLWQCRALCTLETDFGTIFSQKMDDPPALSRDPNPKLTNQLVPVVKKINKCSHLERWNASGLSASDPPLFQTQGVRVEKSSGKECIIKARTR